MEMKNDGLQQGRICLYKSIYKTTPLIFAIKHEKMDIIKLLLSCENVDINAKLVEKTYCVMVLCQEKILII